MKWFFRAKPRLSVVVVFHNMRREAARTLYTLTVPYQRNVSVSDYEVIAIDSDSSEPLEEDWVTGFQDNFRYLRSESDWPTPNRAMNQGIKAARADWVVCMIDGARMLSPGILANMLRAVAAWPDTYMYTLGFHLGHKLQNVAMVEDGYDQQVEDRMLADVAWQTDGYVLFDVACLAASCAQGYLGAINESNCFCAPKKILMDMGGFDERFHSLGGGFVNLDLHKRLMQVERLTPVMLLGEGTFHQFHGGVATNVADNRERVVEFAREYRLLRGHEYRPPGVGRTHYLGHIHLASRRFVKNYHDR